METFVEVDALKKALNALLLLSRGARMPAAKAIKLVATEDKVVLTATDTEVYATRTIQAETKTEGVLCVNASLFQQFVSTLQVTEVTIKAEGFNLSIEAERVKALVNGIDPDDFPEKHEPDNLHRYFDIDTKLFFHHIKQVIDAVSLGNDGRPPQLTGIFLHDKDKHVYMAATDGHRLAREPIMDAITEDVHLIIPPKAMQYAEKLFTEEPNLSLSFDENTIALSGDNARLVARLIDGNYPDYSGIVPKQYTTKVSANKDSLRSALQSALVFAQGDIPAVMLAFSEENQTLTVQGRRANDSDGESNVTVEVNVEGQSLSIKLNGRFVLIALEHIEKDELVIGINSNVSPVIFTDKLDSNSYYHVVGPLAAK